MEPTLIVWFVALGLGALGVALAIGVVVPTRRAALRRELLEHLALAAGRGLPLGPAVTALADERRPAPGARRPRGRGAREAAALDRLAGALDAAGSLGAGLEAAPALGFPAEPVALVRAAEGRGALPEVLRQLAAEGRAQDDAGAAVRASLAYPLVVGTVLGGVALFMTVVVAPRFVEIFRSMDLDAGAPFWAWAGLAELLERDWPTLAVGGGLAALGLRLGLRRPALRSAARGLVRRTPLIGPPLRRLAAGLALQRVGALLGAGATLPEALDAAAAAGGAPGAAPAATLARAGRPPAEVLERLLDRDAPDLAPRLALELDRAPAFAAGLVAAGEGFARRARERLATLAEAARPAPVIALALVVGAMHLAVWTPILRIQAAMVEEPTR